MNLLQGLQVLNFDSFGSPGNSTLYPLYEELEVQRQHFSQRKKEIEELLHMMAMRVDAENMYSQSLLNIAARNPDDSIGVGLLAREVDCFRQDCQAKARAAEELAINVQQDCIDSLQKLIDQQEDEY